MIDSAKSGLTLEFSKDLKWTIPAPSAAVGYATRTIIAELRLALAENREPDVEKLNKLLDVGVDYTKFDAVDAIVPREILGDMLSKLDIDQMEIVNRAVITWVVEGRDSAEDYLADPFGKKAARKQPQDHKTSKRAATPK